MTNKLKKISPKEHADRLIDDLCITDSTEIDIEAIADDQGLEVRYDRLQGCEAMLVGYGNRAIATINKSASLGRQRFSIAHEIGHWIMHRGRSFRCRVDDIAHNFSSHNDLEKEADDFSSNLLMPKAIITEDLKGIKKPTANDLLSVAEKYSVSFQALSIRLANLDTLPVIVACYSGGRIKWHSSARHIPYRWGKPKSVLDENSFAYDVMRGQDLVAHNFRLQSADVWFDQDDADEFELYENSISMGPGDVFVVLYLSQISMLSAYRAKY